jgi:raffinose/stachyose/melibiose transport system substrate-binding protein
MRAPLLKLTVAAAAIALASTGCTGGAPSSSGGDQNSIRYLIEQPEDAATLKLIQKHIGDWAAKAGIDVKVEAMPTENMRTVLQTQLRSGEGPDVFSWGSGPGYAGALAKAGLLYDLTDAYKKYHWNIYDFAKDRVTFGGKTYGVPGEMETIGLYYNETLFSKLGIDPPKSLADLKAVCDRLKSQGIVPLGVSDQEGWQGGHLLSMALSSEIGSKGMAALLNGDASWDSPEVVKALQIWQDFNQAGYLPDTPTSLSYDGASALFYSQDVAMLPTGSWLISSLDKDAHFKVGYIPFPAENGPGIFTGGLGSGPFISANTSKTAAALKLVNFLASPEHGRWTVENLHTIPPEPINTSGLDISPLFAQVLKDTAKFSNGSADFGYNIDVMETDVFNQAMWDGLQAILTGQESAAQVAQDLESAAQK